MKLDADKVARLLDSSQSIHRRAKAMHIDSQQWTDTRWALLGMELIAEAQRLERVALEIVSDALGIDIQEERDI